MRLGIVLFIFAGIIGVYLLYVSWPLLTGKTYILKPKPIDPFDLFRGQYLAINYEMSTIPSIEGANRGDTVYVQLEKDQEGIARYKKASLTPLPSSIKGVVRYNNEQTMQVEYGIEQYFFERNAYFSITNITVEIRISASGQAKIYQLLQNGKPLKIEYGNFSLTS